MTRHQIYDKMDKYDRLDNELRVLQDEIAKDMEGAPSDVRVDILSRVLALMSRAKEG